MAVGADHGATAGLLSQADSHVKELEELEDYYFEADRQAKMTAVANKVVDSVDRSLATLRPLPQDLNARGLFLKGRALSFLPGRDAKAEELLSKALKLDPKLLAAWNALGEVHWNTQNYHRSRECFEHALEFCGENSISLRGLSMVLRAVETDGAAKVDDSVRQANFQKALEKAKAAIALDAGDAQNWENLGNAYVGDFFVNARRPDELSRALIAYGKAEAIYGKLGKANPSLQLNRGMAAKYLEDYDLALRSFRKAQEIGSPNAAKEEQKVVELVQKLAGYAQRKGDLKSKHLKELLDDMKQVAEGQRSLRDLRANTGSADVPLVAKVVNIVDRLQDLPMIITCCDAHGDFFALSLYNVDPSKVADSVVLMKSIIHIRQPKFREVSIDVNHKTWSYPCVRVGNAGDVSVVGGSSLESAAVLSKFSAAALPREPQPEASEDPTPSGRSDSLPSFQCEMETEVDPKQERWIDQEDAKIKKDEAKAKAKAKAKLTKKGKSKKKEKSSEKDIGSTSSQLEAVGQVGKLDGTDIDAELETNTGSESSSENDKNSKVTAEEIEEETPEKALQKVRWSDLDNESDDDFVPRREMSARLAAAHLPMIA